ncbi:type II toxin-antitoxin system HicB family antitoxin [Halorubrum pallidum]|uniref:Type II toxin-antitoxin system HicB family antitoxin n=1 Tax=Halorubrum pallidum TaxID=1526114 RepID=A0ABD5T372_9EURY
MATTSENDRGGGVVFTYEEDLVTARDTESGVAASGTSKPAALSRLADALTLQAGGGEPIDDEEAFLEEIGVDADEIDDAGEPPWE